MRGLKVFLDDESIPMRTAEDVQALRDYLDAYLRLRPLRTMVTPPVKRSISSAPRMPNGMGEHSPRKQSGMADKITHALTELGGMGTGDAIYEKLLELGYSLTAADPRAAVKTYMRQPQSDFVKYGNDEAGGTVWALPSALEEPPLALSGRNSPRVPPPQEVKEFESSPFVAFPSLEKTNDEEDIWADE